jgi:hypothetical protein
MQEAACKQWREANPEYNKQHYAENHERELERRKQYYATNARKSANRGSDGKQKTQSSTYGKPQKDEPKNVG